MFSDPLMQHNFITAARGWEWDAYGNSFPGTKQTGCIADDQQEHTEQ